MQPFGHENLRRCDGRRRSAADQSEAPESGVEINCDSDDYNDKGGSCFNAGHRSRTIPQPPGYISGDCPRHEHGKNQRFGDRSNVGGHITILV